ncbi:glutamine amidotransferase-related protein [Zobellella iuensis]|uniref:Glutamine amidotransferase n=1 Tax=Zobellella iuensis TaxID=2803811 RepID=A0ABS1QSN2_9GAMM|nr:glutamine amidotransferase [Zobellella iuensis]MBL1377884.1 glutamine amidotransferase [Zobellella iuensis]
MQLGLLLCDHIDPEFRRAGGDYPDLFFDRIREVMPNARLRVFDAEAGELPEPETRLDGWIISGARHDAFGDYPWLARLKCRVHELLAAGQRVAGVCFGHQLLALMHGGEVNRAPVGWGIGNHGYRWQAGGGPDYRLLVSHQDQVLRLPERARLLAGSAFCPHAAFTLGERVMGVQGHPEFTPDYARFLMERRRHRFDDERYRSAMDSIEQPHHGAEVMGMILAFLRGESPHVPDDTGNPVA